MRAPHRSGALWLAALMLAQAAPLAAEPFVPERDDIVVETLAADPAQDDALRAQRARHAADPTNLPTAVRLAAAYTELGRTRADPRYDGYAEATLAPWWDLEQPPAPVLLLRATLAQRRHDFEAALADLDRVLAREPEHPQAWLSKATIQAVRGETGTALAACAKLTGRFDPLIEAACVASVARNTGDAASAYGDLAALVGEAAASSPSIVAWTQTLLGELAAQQDDPQAAEKHFLQALGADPDNAYTLGAYADLLLDQGRTGDTRDLLEDRTAVDPLLLRLAIALDLLGDSARDRYVAMLASRFETARRRGDVVHRREEARFALALLHQPERALELALANVAVQREPADLRLVLEAALAAGRPEAAQPTLERLAQSGLIDPQIQALQARFREAS